jgi:anaerobic C4-dicarboxylate transporter
LYLLAALVTVLTSLLTTTWLLLEEEELDDDEELGDELEEKLLEEFPLEEQPTKKTHKADKITWDFFIINCYTLSTLHQ